MCDYVKVFLNRLIVQTQNAQNIQGEHYVALPHMKYFDIISAEGVISSTGISISEVRNNMGTARAITEL